MSDFNVLVNKILEDAQIAKQNIITKAKDESEKIVSKKIDEANEFKAKLLNKAEIDGRELKEKLISKCELKNRNNILLSKRKVLDEVFEKALEQLFNLDSDTFIKYLINTLESLDISGEYTLLISNNYLNQKDKILDEVNKIESKEFKIVDVREHDDKDGGFILEKDGVLVNYSFKLLVEFLREQIEYEVLTLLFN